MRSNLDLPIEPPINRGMTLETFDKSAFTLQVPVLAARVPIKEIGRLKKELAPSTLGLSRIQSVLTDPDSKDSRWILLDKPQRDQLPVELLEIIQANDLQLRTHTIPLDYEYWNATQILRAILPEELLDELPSSFTTTGHIAHFNLRDEYLPYKHLIGQVVLDKNKAIETVVNKLDTIDTEFRFFAMEVLAGRPDFNVELSEGGCRFRFDFSKVYWNSRLQGEHQALVDSFDLKDVICDGFAGVGPFALPAAKKGCLGVLASDLNPASAESMRENIKLNKLGENIRCYNMDGRDFFRQAVKEAYNNPFKVPKDHGMSIRAITKKARQEREAKKAAAAANGQSPSPATTSNDASGNQVRVDGRNDVAPVSDSANAAQPENSISLGRFIDHFVLNLPATAIEFLDAFQGIYKPLFQDEAGVESTERREEVLGAMTAYSKARGKEDGLHLPMVHCYCFTKELEDFEADINAHASKTLGYPVSSETLEDYKVHLVRSVAPNKDMYRLSFRLPAKVVFGEEVSPS